MLCHDAPTLGSNGSRLSNSVFARGWLRGRRSELTNGAFRYGNGVQEPERSERFLTVWRLASKYIGLSHSATRRCSGVVRRRGPLPRRRNGPSSRSGSDIESGDWLRTAGRSWRREPSSPSPSSVGRRTRDCCPLPDNSLGIALILFRTDSAGVGRTCSSRLGSTRRTRLLAACG